MLPATLLSEIDRSRSMLDMRDDWNGEGARGYEESTWTRAVSFLKLVFANQIALPLDVPDILAGPDGSIDIHWDRPAYELLINIPVNPNEPAEFYGDDKSGDPKIRIKAKGTINTSENNNGLISWLMRRH